MEANDLKPADMLDIFGTKSTVSMVLSGDRPLSKTHIKRLCERFHIPPDVFFLRSKEMSALDAGKAPSLPTDVEDWHG
jgi:hypothetical protein